MMRKLFCILLFLFLCTQSQAGVQWSGAVLGAEKLQPISKGITFDNTDDYIDLGTTSTYSTALTGAFSISAWARPHDGTAGSIFSKAGASGSRGVNLYYEDDITDYWEFHLAPTSTTLVFASGDFVPTLNTWYHLAVVYVPSTSLTLYINGVAYTNTTSIPASSYMPSLEPRIGMRSDNIQQFDGDITECALWNTNLTMTQVQSLYTNIKGKPLRVQTANLLDYWALDDVPVGESADGDTFVSQGSGANSGTGVDGANNTGLTSVAVSI